MTTSVQNILNEFLPKELTNMIIYKYKGVEHPHAVIMNRYIYLCNEIYKMSDMTCHSTGKISFYDFTFFLRYNGVGLTHKEIHNIILS